MIWGVGTGRCGTKSLAKTLGGLHEPKPWIADDVCPRTPALIKKLETRAIMDTPIIVDLYQSWCMDLIEEVDPAAEWMFIARNPVECVASFAIGRSERLQAKPDLDEIIHYWVSVNNKILLHLAQSKRRACVITTDQLECRENVYPLQMWSFTRHDAAEIFERCWSTWGEIQKRVNCASI